MPAVDPTASHLPQVRSFDLFDTLIGRLHYRPECIFELVEHRFPFPGFSFYRMAAEYKSDRTLPNIYEHFQELTGITKEEASKLMQFEFETEKSEIFPILENLNLVQDGDLVVSDTYYETNQIKELLNQVQCNRNVRIYASPRGKSSGLIWGPLKHFHSIASHLGDSFHSDVKMPTSHQIPAIHYTNGRLSPEEQSILDIGQPELAYLMRTLRLSNPYPPQSLEWLLWNDQSKFNVPVLVQSSLYLHDFCEKHKKNRILFTSRDGCLWIQIFQKLYPQYDSIYFHASRHAYIFPTPSYIEYVRGLYTNDTVITDSYGRGYSCKVFFTTYLNIEPMYLAIVNSGPNHHAIFRNKTICESIEMLNYDTCGTLYSFQDQTPLRCEPEYPLKYILPMHACIKKCLEILPSFKIHTFDQAVIEWAVRSMPSSLAIHQYLLHAKYHCHVPDPTGLRHVHIVANPN